MVLFIEGFVLWSSPLSPCSLIDHGSRVAEDQLLQILLKCSRRDLPAMDCSVPALPARTSESQDGDSTTEIQGLW